jgi:hypothetical protein
MGRDAVSSVSTNEPHDELHEAKTSPYAQILDRGYTILQKVLPPATIESALEEYLRTFEKLRSTRSDRLQISHVLEAAPYGPQLRSRVRDSTARDKLREGDWEHVLPRILDVYRKAANGAS